MDFGGPMGHPGDTLEIPRASHPPRSSRYHRIRHRTWKVLSLHEGADRLALIVNRGLVAVIVVSVLDAIVGTVSEVRMAYGEVLDWIEVASVTLFLLEYVARLWSTVEDAAFGFIVMENGATITLDATWALNTSTPVREGSVVLCGDKDPSPIINAGTLQH